jgi:hypothetical protein
MSSADGGELGGDRERRAARMAAELTSAMLGVGDRDLDAALGEVTDEDAPAVLAALVRHLAGLMAAQQLRDFDLAADVEEAPDDDDDAGMAGVPDEALPLDPFQSSEDEVSNMLEEAGALFEALAEQRTVPDLMRAVGALDESEALAIVFEQALRQMADRQRPGR